MTQRIRVELSATQRNDMWVGINQSGDIAPAAFLQNGKFLVPVRAPHGCEDLKKDLEYMKPFLKPQKSQDKS